MKLEWFPPPVSLFGTDAGKQGAAGDEAMGDEAHKGAGEKRLKSQPSFHQMPSGNMKSILEKISISFTRDEMISLQKISPQDKWRQINMERETFLV